MRMAVEEMAAVDLGDLGGRVGVVNAHATSTIVGDRAEALAIGKICDGFFGKEKLFVTANKSAIGHGFGAAGSIESVFGIKSL
jgi:3-oxoacyl-[acyl-carrier-protein] synthase II